MRWSLLYGGYVDPYKQRMWEADVKITAGTDGASVMQILRGIRPEGEPATDVMLRVYDGDGGTLHRYNENGAIVATRVYGRWVNLKVAHDTATGTIRVFVDDRLALTTTDNGPGVRRFKNGVYHAGEGRAEARFRNIRFWMRE